jgi:hypothetical protein
MSCSQAFQDLFVISMTKQKRGGFFVEIGSNHPKMDNNTYILETVFDWKGLMVEYDKQYGELYKIHRPKSIHELKDARMVDYRGILDNNGFPSNIDYLQIDLDVDNRSTLDTLYLLDQTCFDKYKFATITFEHDIYRGDYFNTRQLSREIFKKRGYELVFPDVSLFNLGQFCVFEDWYVHPLLVDMDFVNSIRSDFSLKADVIRYRL